MCVIQETFVYFVLFDIRGRDTMVSITRTTCRVRIINNLKRDLELLFDISVQNDERSSGLLDIFPKNKSTDKIIFRSSYGKPVDIWACGCMKSIFVLNKSA